MIPQLLCLCACVVFAAETPAMTAVPDTLSGIAAVEAHLNLNKGAGFTKESLKNHMKTNHLAHFTKKHATMMGHMDEGFGPESVGHLDGNSDGFLTLDEFKDKGAYAGMMTGGAAWYGQEKKFKEADTDGDNKLTIEEMVEHHKKSVTVDLYMDMIMRDLMGADKDKDDTISEGEFYRFRRVFEEHFEKKEL
jgi:hypothetical protein